MITNLRLTLFALCISLIGCTQTTPEPDYSGIRNLTYTITQDATTLVEASHVSVYPNPFVGRVSVELYASVPKDAIVYVSDEKGKYRKEIHLEVEGRRQVNIDFSDMPKGIYLCEVELAGKRQLFRLIKAS